MNITSETIKSAIAKTLALHYPNPEYTLYKNKPQKGMKTPCFFIEQIEPKLRKKSSDRYNLSSLMTIRLHNDNASRTDLDSVGFNLMDIFTTLYVEGEALCHGKDIKYKVIDGVLHFFVTYSLTVIKPKKSIKMEELDLKAGVK